MSQEFGREVLQSCPWVGGLCGVRSAQATSACWSAWHRKGRKFVWGKAIFCSTHTKDQCCSARGFRPAGQPAMGYTDLPSALPELVGASGCQAVLAHVETREVSVCELLVQEWGTDWVPPHRGTHREGGSRGGGSHMTDDPHRASLARASGVVRPGGTWMIKISMCSIRYTLISGC